MIGDSISLQAPLQATTFDPDGLALAESDRFIERIDKKHLSIPLIPGPRGALVRPNRNPNEFSGEAVARSKYR
jgi:hypothetical protein